MLVVARISVSKGRQRGLVLAGRELRRAEIESTLVMAGKDTRMSRAELESRLRLEVVDGLRAGSKPAQRVCASMSGWSS